MTQRDREKILAILEEARGFLKGNGGCYDAYHHYKELHRARCIVWKDERADAKALRD